MLLVSSVNIFLNLAIDPDDFILYLFFSKSLYVICFELICMQVVSFGSRVFVCLCVFGLPMDVQLLQYHFLKRLFFCAFVKNPLGSGARVAQSVERLTLDS